MVPLAETFHEKTAVSVLTSIINSETPIFTGLDYGNLIHFDYRKSMD